MASQVGGVFGTLQQVLQDRAFQRGKLGRATAPRTGDMDVNVVRDATVLDHEDAVGKGYGFRYVMRHQDRREGLILPDPFEQPLHRDPRQGIERAERLVERQYAGTADQRPRQRHALLLSAG